jgi:hypothetical protein
VQEHISLADTIREARLRLAAIEKPSGTEG